MKMNTSKGKQFGKKILQKIRLRFLTSKDIKRFSKTASLSLYDASFDQLTSRIIYNVHAIEKGMSHSYNFRAGFGKKALSDLNDSLVLYMEKDYDLEGFAYKEGRSIILKYISLHNEKDEDTSFLADYVDTEFMQKDEKYRCTGVKEVIGKDK